MIKKRRQKGRQSSHKPVSPKGNSRQTVSRVFDIALICITAGVIFYLALFVIRVSSGYSKTRQTPDQIIRLQVVDGSGDRGVANDILKKLNSFSDFSLEIKVIGSEEFSLRALPTSYIISRVSDIESAKLLAVRLGLSDGEVIYKPIENNENQITTILVLGVDARERFLINHETMGG